MSGDTCQVTLSAALLSVDSWLMRAAFRFDPHKVVRSDRLLLTENIHRETSGDS
jgi:hypothetical protein